MSPRIPRLPLPRDKGANTALICITWTLVAVKIIGFGFLSFSPLASSLFEFGYTILGIILIRSSSRTNKINGWIVVCYEIFQFLIGVGRGLSHLP